MRDLAVRIVPSYRSARGRARIRGVIGSTVGVTTADTTSSRNQAIWRRFRRVILLITPVKISPSRNRGYSNVSPKATTSRKRKERYSDARGTSVMWLPPRYRKMRRAGSTKTKA